MVQFSLGCSYYATTYYSRFGGLRFDPLASILKGSVVGDLLRRLGSLWDGPEKHPLWPLSIAIVVYIYVGTSSKKRCECLERLMNMNTAPQENLNTPSNCATHQAEKTSFESGSQFALGEKWKEAFTWWNAMLWISSPFGPITFLSHF